MAGKTTIVAPEPEDANQPASDSHEQPGQRPSDTITGSFAHDPLADAEHATPALATDADRLLPIPLPHAPQPPDPLQDENSFAYIRRYGNEAALVIGVVTGRSLPELASMSGMSISTVQRRLRTPRVKALINDAYTQMLKQAYGQVLDLQRPAISILREGLTAESEYVRFRSADSLVRTLFKLGADMTLREQVADLQQQLTLVRQAISGSAGEDGDAGVDLLAQLAPDADTLGEDSGDGD